MAVQSDRTGPRRWLAEVTGGPAVWLLASRLLGRPVPVGEPYPHVCGQLVGTDTDGVTPVIMYRNGCAACAAEGYVPRSTVRHDNRRKP